MDRAAWWTVVHGVAESQTQLTTYAQQYKDLQILKNNDKHKALKVY